MAYFSLKIISMVKNYVCTRVIQNIPALLLYSAKPNIEGLLYVRIPTTILSFSPIANLVLK